MPAQLPFHICLRAQELCESRGGRPGLPVPNKPTVSVDVKKKKKKNHSTNHFTFAARLLGCDVTGNQPIRRIREVWTGSLHGPKTAKMEL